MSDLISRQAVLDLLKEHRALYCDNTPDTFSKLSYADKSRVDELDTAIATIINLPSVENKGESKHGQWVRMSDLPEDKDDRYKCSRCGNVVHHSNGVNLYHFNSWCGRCGSLNNSLIAGSDPIGEKGTE